MIGCKPAGQFKNCLCRVDDMAVCTPVSDFFRSFGFGYPGFPHKDVMQFGERLQRHIGPLTRRTDDFEQPARRNDLWIVQIAAPKAFGVSQKIGIDGEAGQASVSFIQVFTPPWTNGDRLGLCPTFLHFREDFLPLPLLNIGFRGRMQFRHDLAMRRDRHPCALLRRTEQFGEGAVRLRGADGHMLTHIHYICEKNTIFNFELGFHFSRDSAKAFP